MGALTTTAALLFVVASHASYAPATELARFADPRIVESSGVSASTRSDEVLFTHNDSGDGARFFAVDRTGATLAVFDVDGARAQDWEDMARGLAPDGGPALFFGDIGDNFRRRPHVTVYVVREPERLTDGTVPLLRRLDLRYEDGPHDAETLLVHPGSGALSVVTKAPDGVAGVYTADRHDQGRRVGVLRRVAEVRLDSVAIQPGGNARAVTSGEIAPDGRRVVLRTLFEAFEWDLPLDGGLSAAFAAPPRRIPLPTTRQGEAIAYTGDGRSLVTTSEGVGAPLHLLAGDTAGRDLLRQPAPRAGPERHRARPPWWYAVGVGGAVVVPVLNLLVQLYRASRRRRRRPPPRRRARSA